VKFIIASDDQEEDFKEEVDEESSGIEDDYEVASPALSIGRLSEETAREMGAPNGAPLKQRKTAHRPLRRRRPARSPSMLDLTNGGMYAGVYIHTFTLYKNFSLTHTLFFSFSCMIIYYVM
tara:strand:+ start:213 stop:575 length:363 start_codon:yes stop_codon:yes gene_type:complete